MSRRRLLFAPCLSTLLAAAVFVSPALAKQPPLPSLSGIVTDPGGRPLSGVTVFVSTAAPRVGVSPSCPSCYADCGKYAATDATGHFRIPALSRYLVFRLLVVRDGYAPTFITPVDPLKGAAVRVTLARAAALDPARTVVGTVFGPDGQPVAGATVEPVGIKSAALNEFGEVEGMDPLAVTDDQGRFRFHSPEPDGTVWATVKARGLATQAVAGLTPGPSGAANRVTLAVGASVTGVVRDTRGRGLSGVTVEVVPTDREVETFTGWQDIGTNADGRFLVPNVPAGRQYAVCVMMGGLTRLGLGAPRRVITTGPDGVTTGDVVLAVCPAATVIGRVSLEGGKPIPAGTRVMLNRDATWDSQQAVLAPDGSFAFHAAPAGETLDFYVTVNGYRYAVDTPDYDQRYREVRMRLPAGVTQKNVPIALVPVGQAIFTIRVTGTPGAKFSGTYVSPGFDNPVSDGVVPAQYAVTGETTSARFQKQGGPGTLKVEILKAGAVVATAETDAPNGVASAATR